MRQIVRKVIVTLCSLGLVLMSSCMTVPGSYGLGSFGTPFGSSSAGGYSPSGSPSTTGAGSFSSASSPPVYASSASTDDPGSNGSPPPGYTNDSSQSNALTSYLQAHRLPLVGAQVLANESGSREVILYGFVATDFGKQDAAGRARRFLNDPGATVLNRIVVRPELLASGKNGSSASPDTSAESNQAGVGDVQGYQNNQAPPPGAQQYTQNQNNAAGLSALIPLIGMMGMLSMGSGGIGMGYGGGGYGGGYPPGYGSPFGGSPYASPYGSPYGSPYSSPYGPPGSFNTFP
jgi:hypothetical protein